MDARKHYWGCFQSTILLFVFAGSAFGASARSQHFIVTAPSQQIAKRVAEAAEGYRKDLAIQWLGRELPAWPDMCPIRVVLNRPASGATSFEFPYGGGMPRHWDMEVNGSLERILDSVLPHEILHTVFATHFKNPLPRWADEGACTTVEGASERGKHDRMLIQFLTGEDGIPFNKMFQLKQYPAKILPLYSQGYSVASYLIAQGGRRKFVNYIQRGMQTNNWTAATREFYGYSSLSDLQVKWVAWVGQGSPPLSRANASDVAAAARPANANANTNLRGGVAVASATTTAPPVRTVASATAPRPIPRPIPQPLATAARPRPINSASARQNPSPVRGLPRSGVGSQGRIVSDDGWYARTARSSQQQSPQPRRVSISKATSLPVAPLQWSGNAAGRNVIR